MFMTKKMIGFISTTLIAIALTIFFLPRSVFAVSEVKESYEPVSFNDWVREVYGTELAAQTFTASENYTLQQVNLALARYSTGYTIRVGIYAVSSGFPTGSELAGADFDATSVSTNYSSPTFVEVALETPLELTQGTEYAIQISASGSTSTERIAFIGYYPGAYADGVASYYTGSWNSATPEAWFQTVGESITETSTSTAFTIEIFYALIVIAVPLIFSVSFALFYMIITR